MHVLIVHYHLNPGGVTRIIEAQVNGLLGTVEPPEITIACGPSVNPVSPRTVRVIENNLLQYHESVSSPVEFYREVSEIAHFLKLNMTTKTILHCHNPNLGKNPAVTAAVYHLAKNGAYVVNHFHDFPEERPSNIDLISRMIQDYTSTPMEEVLYPVLKSYHYAVLNSCDHSRLLKKGIPAGQVHLLPNPVEPFGNDSTTINRSAVHEKIGADQNKLLVTYPVRAIRRKNLGEFILLSVLFSGKASFAVTLAPLNPVELPLYNRWKEFCRENRIPVIFEAGIKTNYADLIKFSDFCITTSIQEGFGMTYLEPWLAGTPVIGRELECIINDLKSKDMSFPKLYNRIIVDQEGVEVDFKDLSPPVQEQVIRSLKHDQSSMKKLFAQNPSLFNLLDPVPEPIIASNRDVIRQHFSTKAYGRELFGIYQEIAG